MKRKASFPKLPPIKRRRTVKKQASKTSLFQQATQSKAKKSVDVNVTTSALNSTGLITPINLLTAGTDLFEIVGAKAIFKSIEMDWGLVSLRQNTAIEYGRVMLIYDKQPNGAIPTIADVLLDADAAGSLVTDPYSGINLNNRNRFVIIRDIRMMLPLINTTATTTLVFPTDKDTFGGHIFRKMSLETIYKNQPRGTIAEIESGSILLLTLGNVTAGSEGWSLRYKIRLRYEDNL